MKLVATEFICVCCKKRVTHSELIHKAIVGVRVLCADCVADAALGRAVRKMPKTGSRLWHHYDDTWGFYDGSGDKKETSDEPTPEAALKAAGLMEGEQMKNIKIELNANEASGEAYWRKRCDAVEAELIRLRAVNAELANALRSIRPIVEAIHTALATTPTDIETQCLYDEADGLVDAIDAAISRAEQAGTAEGSGK